MKSESTDSRIGNSTYIKNESKEKHDDQDNSEQLHQIVTDDQCGVQSDIMDRHTTDEKLTLAISRNAETPTSEEIKKVAPIAQQLGTLFQPHTG